MSITLQKMSGKDHAKQRIQGQLINFNLINSLLWMHFTVIIQLIFGWQLWWVNDNEYVPLQNLKDKTF